MLIACVAYQDGRKLADITVDEISDYVQKPECFVWVALKDPEPAELDAMREEFGLHELAVEDVRTHHQWPKIEEYGDSLFAVMHTVELTEDGGLLFGEVDVFVGRNYVLSVRMRATRGFKRVRERCESEPPMLRQGSAFVLYALMDDIVDGYFHVLETLAADLDVLEDRIFARQAHSESRALIEDLYRFKRRLVVLRHHVGPLLEGVGKLTGGRVPGICAGMTAYFKDVYVHLERIVGAIDGRRDMVITAIQVNLGMIALADSEITKRLGTFAAMFAVPTMIAGIYGMNFEHMPELHARFGYPVVIAVIVTIDALLFRWFRKAKWI
ncbi:magnesium transport protein CorA [Burkholderia sp. SFA1]|uniref:Magnesium transport protein CorA n=1 Tax=Caballeronia cordobensis TaxID=1353886 RepID=A0A158IA79_CABCO|nr:MULTISPECIES: magnesium/cobalt transporter CorA [Caballeronia]MCE4574115.1 magnesium/cobalt transporter CorA [Caballeronia sp. CLC5]BBP99498.1 magnesium transport protein CorA [Burkholderia sp. SFA1]SAL53474.1 magnesium and cobalt transport protein CorA [Caballeronia cordobensis]